MMNKELKQKIKEYPNDPKVKELQLRKKSIIPGKLHGAAAALAAAAANSDMIEGVKLPLTDKVAYTAAAIGIGTLAARNAMRRNALDVVTDEHIQQKEAAMAIGKSAEFQAITEQASEARRAMPSDPQENAVAHNPRPASN